MRTSTSPGKTMRAAYARGGRRAVRIGALAATAALSGCGSSDSGDASIVVVNGVPRFEDSHGNVVRPITLPCNGFMIGSGHHKCTDSYVNAVAVSPDGTKLAYSRYVSDGEQPPAELGVINLDGTHQRTLISARSQDFGGAKSLSWTADGRRILYDYDDEALESIDVDGTHRRVLRKYP